MTMLEQPQMQSPLRKVLTHHEYDASFIETIDGGWDELGYIECRKRGDFEGADRILDDWLSSRVGMRIGEWNMKDQQEKREVIFNWVESHQPDDWVSQTDPPLTSDFAGRDERIPFNFMNNLHSFVAEELAKLINKRNSKASGRPLAEDEIVDAEDHIVPYLEVFTGLGTPADTLYGTDFYFKYQYTDAAGVVRTIKYYIDITKDKAAKEEKLKYRFDKADYPLAFELNDEEGRKRKMTSDDIEKEGKNIAVGIFGKLDAKSDSLVAN